ncbi:YbaK/EbsC family protein [Aeromicrobium sp. UC242_57]|uniref:YbaK/EbsC family protein n=1 Tax=Aeromicrobium sp. UC242_57 TaxID=3374624 RepID=UPI0037B3E72E
MPTPRRSRRRPETLGVAPGAIAKTLVILANGEPVVVVASGHARIDNRKFRDRFGAKPRMAPADLTHELTGQPVGGVGPFGHPNPLALFCDESLRAFDTVYPAAGTPASAFGIAPERIAELAGAQWVDVTKTPE